MGKVKGGVVKSLSFSALSRETTLQLPLGGKMGSRVKPEKDRVGPRKTEWGEKDKVGARKKTQITVILGPEPGNYLTVAAGW